MKLKPNIQQSLRIHITGGSLAGDFVLPPGYYILGRLGDKELAKTLSECFFVSRAHCVLAVGEEPMLYVFGGDQDTGVVRSSIQF